MRKLLDSPWKTLSIPFALTPIGQLHQSPPSPVPGGPSFFVLRVEFLLKTDGGYPKDTGVNKP